MLMVMVLNDQGVWAAMPFNFESEREAWDAARSYDKYRAVRIIRVIGEIERLPATAIEALKDQK